MLKKIVILLSMFSISVYGAVALSNVKVKQRYPWNGKVDISFNLAGTRVNNNITVSALDTSTGKSLNVATIYDSDGNLISLPIKLTPGKHYLVWDADADVKEKYRIDALSVTISAGKHYELPLYQVIDLSGGISAERFPITALSEVPKGGWTKEYKTTKLVLKLIQPGRVHLGPSSLNGVSDDTADAIITKPFYIGVFKVTRKQWVMGSFNGTDMGWGAADGVKDLFNYYISLFSESAAKNLDLDQCPIAETPPYVLRGEDYIKKWPYDKSVAANSFFGVLRQKTGLNTFDLPTEVEWEYAARAGTTENKDLPFNGRDDIPNSWGLYEMMDDISEVCVDGHFMAYEQEFHGRVVSDPIGNPEADRRNCRNYWVSKRSPGVVMNGGIGQRMCILNGYMTTVCPLSFRVGCFPFR